MIEQILFCIIIFQSKEVMKMLKIVLFVMACLGFVMAGELKYDGLFGQWTNEVKPADGFYLCGAEMRFEDNKVGVNDDTATNGFRFKFCQYDNWNNQKLSQFQGLWGTWKGMVMCPQDYFVGGMQVRFQKYMAKQGDDTAFNGLRLLCRNKKLQEKIINIYAGLWGDWENWIKAAPNEYIVAYKVRSQPDQLKNDDTALNGLSFRTQLVFDQKLQSKPLSSKIFESIGYFTNDVHWQIGLQILEKVTLQPASFNFINNGILPVFRQRSFSITINQQRNWSPTSGSQVAGQSYSGLVNYPTGDISDWSENGPIFKNTKYKSIDFTYSSQQQVTFGKSYKSVSVVTQPSKQYECPPCSSCQFSFHVTQRKVGIPYIMNGKDNNVLVISNGIFTGNGFYSKEVKTIIIPLSKCV